MPSSGITSNASHRAATLSVAVSRSYRAIDVSIAQNEQRKKRKLTLPVLAIGGGKALGEGVANTMRLVAENVESKIIPDSGHWVAEEAPEQLLAVLTPFLAPYRDAAAQ